MIANFIYTYPCIDMLVRNANNNHACTYVTKTILLLQDMIWEYSNFLCTYILLCVRYVYMNEYTCICYNTYIPCMFCFTASIFPRSHSHPWVTWRLSGCTALETCLHMKIDDQLLVCADTRKHALSSECKPTNADKCLALNTSRKCKLKLISLIQANKYRYTLRFLYVQILDHCTTFGMMQVHSQPFMLRLADASRYMTSPHYVQTHADVR